MEAAQDSFSVSPVSTLHSMVPHCTDEDTKVLRGQVMFPRPYTWHRILATHHYHFPGQSCVALTRLLDLSEPLVPHL